MEAKDNQNLDTSKLLREKAWAGLDKLKLADKEEYRDRLSYELSVVEKLGFETYFLVVQDIIRWAKERMFCGIGRGSCAASLLAYCLEITAIDPIKYNLIFERFLNPGRAGDLNISVEEIPFESFEEEILSSIDNKDYSEEEKELSFPKSKVVHKDIQNRAESEWEELTFHQKLYILYLINKNKTYTGRNSFLLHCFGLVDRPSAQSDRIQSGGGLCDIDADFPTKEEVIDYIRQKYGKEHVARIGTWGLLRTKSAIRDIGRSLDKPDELINETAKLVPPPRHGLWESFEEEIKVEPRLLDKRYKDLVDPVNKLWGILRNYGTHAAGVVISPEPVIDVLPLYKDKEGNTVTQFDYRDVEKIGLIKLDILGLSTLRIIDSTLKQIRDKGHHLDLYNLPDKDKKTYETISKGDLEGVFQLADSAASLTVAFQPECIEDLSIINAINRPGPMGMGVGDRILQRKRGEKEITYLHPSLEPVLKETWGEIVYQEQVMRIFMDLARYSLTKADEVRGILGKKKTEKMALERPKFVEGCSVNHIGKDIAEKIFDMMADYATYLFNSCLVPETKVLGQNNQIFTIEKIKQQLDSKHSVFLQAYDPNSKQIISDECLEVIDSGIQETVIIKLDNGQEIECTMEHSFLCTDGKKYKLSEILDKNLDLVQVNTI